MPRGDRTGPIGMGSMTGRAAGYCAGYPVPGFMNQVPGRGFGGGGYGWGRGGGRGGGRGHRHWYYATGLTGWERAWRSWPGYHPPYPGTFDAEMTKKQELEALNQQAEYFEKALDDLKARIREVESSKADSQSP